MAHSSEWLSFDPFDLTGRKAAKEAEEKNEANVASALGEIDLGSDKALADMGLSIEQFQAALDFFQQGFPGVMEELDAVGDASLTAAYDEFKGRVSEGEDSLIGSGRFGTSVKESLAGGERSRYLRDVSAINEGLGQLRSNVRLGGLGAISGLMQNLGDAFERRGAVEMQRGFKKADFRAGVQYVSPGSTGQRTLGAAKDIFSLFGGGD